MDGSRFDEMTRSVATRSRRSLLGAAAGGLLALTTGRVAKAAGGSLWRPPAAVCLVGQTYGWRADLGQNGCCVPKNHTFNDFSDGYFCSLVCRNDLFGINGPHCCADYPGGLAGCAHPDGSSYSMCTTGPAA